MKKTLSILALVITLAACKSKVNTADNKNMVLVDTTGLSKHNVLIDAGNNKYVVAEKPVAPVSKPVTSKSSANANDNNSNAVHSGTNTTTNASYPQDKGWSHAAKATAVGGGSGAVIGAIVNKDNRVGGAIVGTVIGAGAGYVIGRSVDKKTGRVARAKARKKSN